METVEKIIGSHLYMIDEIDSTNKELLENVQKYEHGSLLCAKKQNAGRGRYKREWKSQEGGLYFSYILKDQQSITNIYPMVLLTALAVVRSISFCSIKGIAIKWPNDIYVNHRKLCGILAESVSMGNKSHVVVGVGLNVNNHVANLEDLRHPAVSLKECSGATVDVFQVLEYIIEELNSLYFLFKQERFSELLPELNRYLYSKDSQIEIQTPSGKKTIIPLAFTNDAKLHCLESGKEIDLFMGEF